MLKVSIRTVFNGYIVTCEGVNTVYPEGVHGFRELLWDMNELIGPSSSRYDKERISVTIIQGDKYEEQEA